MPSSPYCFIVFTGPTTLADAAGELSKHGLHVVGKSDGLTVQWAPDRGPVLDIGLNAESWVLSETRELAEEKGLPALMNLDRRFEIPFADFDDLEEVLNDYNTLFEVQATLQDLTDGYIWMSWNGNIIAPEN